MSIVYGMAVFFMIWWIVLFAVLPFGVRQSQREAGEVVPGSEPGAPDMPRMMRVLIGTTVVTTIVFLSYLWVRDSGFSLDDIPFLTPPSQR